MDTKVKTRPINMKVFQVKPLNQQVIDINFEELLKKRLDATEDIYERFLQLNQNDPNGEGDFVSYFDTGRDVLFGAIVRMKKGAAIQIAKDQLSKKNVTPNDFITVSNEKFAGTLYSCVFFCISKNILVINCGQSIKSFQTYANWLINDKELYCFEPVIKKQDGVPFDSIKSIKVQESFFNKNFSDEIKIMKQAVLETMIDDVAKAASICAEDIISAQILLKFRLNKDKKEEDVNTALKTLLKIGFSEDIIAETKSGRKIRGDYFELKKTVAIEVSEAGLLSDEQIKQEMTVFIKEV